MVEAGCHIFEYIVAHRVCDRRAFCAFHAHHRADQRFVVARIPHSPLHRAALCREGEEVCQQEYEKEEFQSHRGEGVYRSFVLKSSAKIQKSPRAALYEGIIWGF